MKESFVIYKSFYRPIRSLSLDYKGLILDAMFQYQIDGSIPELPPVVNMAFQFIRDQFDRNNAKYEIVVERNKTNGSKGGRPRITQKTQWDKNSSNNPNEPKKADNGNEKDNEMGSKKTTSKFIKPSIEEIKAYCSENKIKVDENAFFDYYESNGWMVGKVNMKNWEASARKWGRSTPDNQQPQKSQSHETPEEWKS